jgi:uncharacterized protein (DUF1015 family)
MSKCPWYSPRVAEIRPFGALRYAAVDDLSAVLAPPYDVISPSQQDELHGLDPHNVVRLELARGGTDEPLAGRYAHAAETLHQWRRQNVLGRDAQPAYYPYEERFDGLTRRGFFATVRLHPWSYGVVLPHERTRPKPKADRRELLHTCRTQFSPIFSLFEDRDGAVRELLEDASQADPVACAQTEAPVFGEIARGHVLWRTEGALANRLTMLLADKRLFIADGHHRYETALDYRDERRQAEQSWTPDAPYELAMMLLVPVEDPGLVVLPTHRLVTLEQPPDAAALLAGWRETFAVECAPLPTVPAAIADELARRGREGHVFAAVGVEPGTVHYLTLRQPPEQWPHPATWRDLGVGLLEALIVEPLQHAHPGTAVEFTRDPAEAVGHVRASQRNLAFLLNPTGVEQILTVASAGDRMPEKSTYFAPKVATGLVMYPLEPPRR